ncbi:MAG: hypothetical protein U0Q55_23465 [Vicinamibacterales bacterium]
MRLHRLAGVWTLCLLTAGPAAAPAAGQAQAPAASSPDDVALFRVFLTDGSSLVSYGEFARLDDSVVFSMPISTGRDPQLQLVNIASSKVDWTRTLNYAESVRSARYVATRGQADYEQLSTEIAKALNDVSAAQTAAERLAIVEKARRTLADWPAAHYNYKRDDIQQMLATLDEAIAGLKAATGARAFDLALVAASTPPPAEPVLPPPGPRETIEVMLRAASLTPSPAERMMLLTTAANALDADAAKLPPAWAAATMADVQAKIQREQELDRRYQAMSARMLNLATSRARQADVRGVQRVIASIRANDELLGSVRPDVVAAVTAAVEDQLDAARRLRLERDAWALRAPELRAYRTAMAPTLVRLQRMAPLLEDIKALAGSGPDALGAILRSVDLARRDVRLIKPPDDLRDLHEMFGSALQLALNAARIRREAALRANVTRAWDASSAAAGALMLAQRARTDLLKALQPPQLSR